MERRGFTLTEMLVTVMVIGILAAIAIPQYHRTVERGHWRSSQDVLRAIYAGEQVYFTMNDEYVALTVASPLIDWNKIYTDNPNISSPMPVAFSVLAGGLGPGATFTATADRGGGQFMKIDNTNTLDTAAWPQP